MKENLRDKNERRVESGPQDPYGKEKISFNLLTSLLKRRYDKAIQNDMEEIDISIVGAGVVGLAIGAELAKSGKEVYIFDRHDTFGQEASSRNSEVIHAGIYYLPGSLKANLCVEGNALLYEICESHGIPYRKRGKLIVATAQSEISKLEELFERGKSNGVRDLSLIDKSGINRLEPYVEGVAAIYSPWTGVLDSHSLMRYFAGVIRNSGGWLVYRAEVVGIDKVSAGYKVTILENGDTYTSFKTSVLINSAGLWSDKIASLVGIDIDEAGYRVRYCKGDYFSVGNGKNALFSHLIYPVPPRDGFVGIHTTHDVYGGLKLGPDEYYVEKIDYQVDESKKSVFYEAVRKFLPFIEQDDLSPDMSGIRPHLMGECFNDFIIRDEEVRGFPGFVNLIGIESPGLTSAPAIAKYVREMLNVK